MTEAELTELEKAACPGCGSCAGMFTANTMNCLTEALGMALPGNGTIPAVDARRTAPGPGGGQAVLSPPAGEPLPPGHHQPRRPSTMPSSWTWRWAAAPTPSCTSWPSPTRPASSFSLTTVNEISDRTPHLCKISPAGEHRIEDLDRAGGIPAVMKEVKKHLDLKVQEGLRPVRSARSWPRPGTGTRMSSAMPRAPYSPRAGWRSSSATWPRRARWSRAPPWRRR